jgi:hypothetical protein
MKIINFYKKLFGPGLEILKKEKVNKSILSYASFITSALFVFLVCIDSYKFAGLIGLFMFFINIFYLIFEDEKEKMFNVVLNKYSFFLFYSGFIVIFLQDSNYIFALFAYITMISILINEMLIEKTDINSLSLKLESIFILSFALLWGNISTLIFLSLVFFTTRIISVCLIWYVWYYNKID